MDAGAALQLLITAHRLKRTRRTGWVMRGVPEAESVADHSFGVALISLVLAEMEGRPLDIGKLLTIALLHDLPESIVGDLPSPAVDHFPPGAKQQAEKAVLDELLAQLDCAEQWQSYWQEFEDGTSIEGQLVRDADRLDMLLQAHIYEQTTGNRWLDEFWPPPGSSPFRLLAARRLYEKLMTIRSSGSDSEN
jgi:putative hydrolase of HD superfamily